MSCRESSLCSHLGGDSFGLLSLLHFDALEKTLLDTVQNGRMLDDGEIFRLGEKLFIWVDAGAKHLACLRTHLGHLLRHLVGS